MHRLTRKQGHYDARTCLYYDSVTRAQCEQFSGCRNTCELQAGDVDCVQLPAPSTSSRCSQPHQVGNTGQQLYNVSCFSLMPHWLQEVVVSWVLPHPDYTVTKSGVAVNDLMLVRLQHAVIFSTWVAPVCLPDL